MFSQCWEDPTVAAEGLELGASDDLLAITSAGDNVLALSLRQPRSLTSLDVSVAQNALLQLKIAALQTLEWEEYVAFLGARPSGVRIQTYFNRVRAELSDAARAFFDTREELIAEGVIHTGRLQRYLRLFRSSILPLVHNQDTVEDFMAIEDRDERSLYYRECWDSLRWRAMFALFFNRFVIGQLVSRPRPPRYVQGVKFNDEFLGRCRHAMIEMSPVDNYFLQYALLGQYPDLERGPVYLRPSHFAQLRETSAAIRIVTADLYAHLQKCDNGALSALYLSDVFDVCGGAYQEQVMTEITRVARPGGRFVYWNLLSSRGRPAELSDRIEAHDERARELHALDRAFVYGGFHVESAVA